MYNNFFETLFNELNDFVGHGVSSSCRKYGEGLECQCNENTYKNADCACKNELRKGNECRWNLNLNSDGYFLNQVVPCGKEDCEIEVVDNTYVKITYNLKEKFDSNGFSHTCNRSGVFSITLPFDADASTLKAKYENGVICFTVEKVKEALKETVKIELN